MAGYRMVTFVVRSKLACVLALACIACGAKPAMPDTPPQPPVPSAEPTAPTVASAAPTVPTPAPSSSSSTTAAQHAALDVTEHGTTMNMPVLFDATAAKSTFPTATVGDRDCWQGLGLTGDYKKDYDAIIARCGAATGLREYV